MRNYSSERKHHTGLIMTLLTLLLFLSIIFSLNVVNNGRVSVDRQNITISTLPSALESFRILHISDLDGQQFGKDQSTVQAALQSFKYNIVCITGDVCAKNGNYSSFLKLIDLFAKKVPVFFIPGDEDPSPVDTLPRTSVPPLAPYITAATEHGAIYLDAPYELTVGGVSLWLIPESVLDLDIESASAQYQASMNTLLTREDSPEKTAALQVAAYRLDVLRRTEEAFFKMKDSDIRIVLSHYPTSAGTALMMQSWAGGNSVSPYKYVSLILAGHTCAGQYRLPGVGALRAPDGSWLPPDSAVTGFSTVMGVTQYITPGLGTCAEYPLPFRFLNSPTVSVLTLTSKLQ